MYTIFKNLVLISMICLFTTVLGYTQLDQVNELLQAVDQSINGTKIVGTFTNITPKLPYNEKAMLRRNNLYVRNSRDKERAEQLNDVAAIMDINKNIQSVEDDFPITEEDVYKVREFEIIYLDGETQVINEVYPDSAGGGQYITNIVLYGLTEDVSVTYLKVSKDTSDLNVKPYATVAKKSQPTNLFFATSAHKFGRGLSSFSASKMTLSKDSGRNDDDVYLVSIEGGNVLPDFPNGYFYIDKTKGYCWTEGYFYNQEGLYLELQASDFREVNGHWFPFTTEMIYYLPESEWTEENKIRKRNIYEISSIETEQSFELDADNLIEPDMKVYRQ